MDVNHYDVLGVDPDADRDTVRAAYRRRARDTHPDAGGSDAEFAAVALAWWTLQSPQRRARYDAGVTEDEDVWGEESGWDEAPAARPAKPPRPAPPRPGEPIPVPGAGREPDLRPVAAGEGAEDADTPADAAPTPHPAPPGPVDALTSEPRVLPPTPPAAGVAAPWAPERRAATLLGSAAVLAVVATVITVPSLAQGDISSGAWAGLIAYGGALYVTLLFRARAHEADRVVRSLAATGVWGSVAFFALSGAMYLDELASAARWAFVAGPLLVGLVLAADSGRRLRRTRRRAGLERFSRRQRALARRWNRVLSLQALHGAAHVEAGLRDGRVAWLLVADRSGQVLDWAPAHAPLAWARLLREAGVDVAPVPEPVVGRTGDGSAARTEAAAG